MIWYDAPVGIAMASAVLYLLAACLQVVVVLEAGELTRERRGLNLFRLRYTVLSALSGVFCWEAQLAVASIEGGVFLPEAFSIRWVALLPVLLLLYERSRPARQFQPSLQTAACLLPLMRLPLADRLPAPLPAILAVFAAALLLGISVWLLFCMLSHARAKITRSALPRMLREIGQGVSVANSRGWILEANPAFYAFCDQMGLKRPERADELDAELTALVGAGKLETGEVEVCRYFRSGDDVFLLQRSRFRAGGRKYLQLALSDISASIHAAAALEQENARLTANNRTLEERIAQLMEEESVHARERLCRTVHDKWSQRLAVAGLSADLMMSGQSVSPEAAAQLSALLEAEPAEFPQEGLQETLRSLTNMYQKLGVEIVVEARAAFDASVQEALCAVLREALANAVRHAYARRVLVRFYEGDTVVGMRVQNDCLESAANVPLGRGLRDMRTRVEQAGGVLRTEKNSRFTVEAIFKKVHLGAGGIS